MKWWIAILTAGAGLAQTAERPVLRIETGMHTASILRISVDAAERYLVSASDDKTVRVWDLPTGRLLRILRPPLGDGNEGKVYAVAISPDGKTVACGGFTGAAGAPKSIYLFDRESGRILRRIPGPVDSVGHLAFSSDGRFLAASFQGSSGVRLYRAPEYILAGEDKEYGASSYSAAFSSASPTQRLVTTSYDGWVRLYGVGADGSLKTLAKQQAPGGKEPFAARFSPDGGRIAVGFHDSMAVNVLSAADLSLLYAPTIAGKSGNLVATEWSTDGSTLFASGTYATILSWAAAGKGTSQEIAAGEDTLASMAPVTGGKVAFGSTDPALGLIGRDAKKVWFQGPPIAIYREALKGFAVSRDATRVAFSYEMSGRSPAWFSVRDRAAGLGTTTPGSAGMPPVSEGLAVTNWQHATMPMLNGKALSGLDKREISRSLAIAPGGQAFLLGADWNIYLFDSAGQKKWKQPAPDSAWSVNVSGDGKLALAAFGDGTIRWYKIEDGKELLAFFPHPDRKRWVLWTPSGYYDASAGAEDLIGWHVNNGPDAAADFYPASRFRSTYYRPDVVGRILDTRDEAEALRLADAEAGQRKQRESITQLLPPIITLVSPSEGSDFSAKTVTLRYRLRSPSGEPVTAVRALVDGRPPDSAKRVVPPAGADVMELQVPVPAKDCEVTLIAENRFTSSEPASVHLRWRGQTSFVLKPKLYLLAIGISRYRAPYDLRMPAKDARDFVNAMLPQKERLYRDVEYKLITDDRATKEGILDGMDWLEKNATQHDVSMVFLSGHGDNERGVYYFMPVNFDSNRLKSTAIAQSDIESTVKNLPGKALFFVDSCHSGNAMGGRAKTLRPDINLLVNELASAENGAVVFAASSGAQVALERDEWGNGAFTKALVEGLSGKASYTQDGKITVNMLDLYISERVKQLTGGVQTPTTTKPKTISDYPIAVK